MNWAWLSFHVFYAIFFGLIAHLERNRKRALYYVYVVSIVLQVVCIILRIMMIVRGG